MLRFGTCHARVFIGSLTLRGYFPLERCSTQVFEFAVYKCVSCINVFEKSSTKEESSSRRLLIRGKPPRLAVRHMPPTLGATGLESQELSAKIMENYHEVTGF